MKIVIVGPGALGSLVAASLSKGKEEVYLLDKDKERAGIINQAGISVEGVSGSWQAQVKTTSEVKDIAGCDLIIICVKSYDTKEAVTRVKSLAGVSLENVKITFFVDDKKQLSIKGKILCTHFGLSGPLILNTAGKIADWLHEGFVTAKIDAYPGLDLGALDKHITKIFDDNKNKILKKLYFFYTTCPKCAKHYGKNYVIAFAEV